MPPRPVHLLDDSQLLFWKNGALPFLHSICDPHLAHDPRAAYIGASNGDAPEYFGIFEAAMQGIGIADCGMIRSAFSSHDRAFLSGADIVMLAGGEVERGWRVLATTGMKEIVVERYRAGATLMGLSAGAVHLGSHGVRERDGDPGELFETFALCPFIVVPHADEKAWSGVARAARALDGPTRGIGIWGGGGLIVHPDGRLEAVRRPAHDLLFEDGAVTRRTSIPVAGDVPSIGSP